MTLESMKVTIKCMEMTLKSMEMTLECMKMTKKTCCKITTYEESFEKVSTQINNTY